MRTKTMRMPVNLKATGARTTIVEMELPDEAFAADGELKNGYSIPDDVRCVIEDVDELARPTGKRHYVRFDETEKP